MKKQIWTDNDIEFLKNNIDKVTLTELAKQMGRTVSGIVHKAQRLGIDERHFPSKKWTTEEETFLIENYKKMKVSELAKLMDRTKDSVSNRARDLGLKDPLKMWTQKEEKYLMTKWGFTTIENMGKRLNRTPESVKAKAVCLGLKDQAYANGMFWTPIDVAEILGIHRVTIYRMLREGTIPHRKFRTGQQEKFQVSVENFKDFLENNKDSWKTYKADMTSIKSLFSKHVIEEDRFSIFNTLPQWMLDKIEEDKADKFKKDEAKYTKQISKKHYKIWTTKEEKRLKGLISSGLPFEEILKYFDREAKSVESKITKLKHRMPKRPKAWTVEEENKLLNFIEQGMSVKDMKKYFKRSENSLRRKTERVTISSSKDKVSPWTVEEKKLLIQFIASDKPFKEVKEHFNRSDKSIRSKINSLKKSIF